MLPLLLTLLSATKTLKPPEDIYGAEALNRVYPFYTGVSLLAAVVLVTAVFLYPLLKAALGPNSGDDKISVKTTRVINYAELAAPPPIDLEKKLPEPLLAAPQPKTVKYLTPVVKKDEEVPDEQQLPTIDELQSASIGTSDIKGTDSVYYEHRDAQLVSEPVEPEKSEAFSFAEQMPEFQGGEQGLYEYLSANMTYPSIAREAGIQGTVYLSFVVEADGSITDVRVIRGVHNLLDQEATRVIASMPKWKAGQQNNMPVRVLFTLPIHFVLKTN